MFYTCSTITVPMRNLVKIPEQRMDYWPRLHQTVPRTAQCWAPFFGSAHSNGGGRIFLPTAGSVNKCSNKLLPSFAAGSNAVLSFFSSFFSFFFFFSIPVSTRQACQILVSTLSQNYFASNKISILYIEYHNNSRRDRHNAAS